MKFFCDKCGAKYQVSDDKVEHRAFQMKCRQCSHMITIPIASQGVAGSSNQQLGLVSSKLLHTQAMVVPPKKPPSAGNLPPDRVAPAAPPTGIPKTTAMIGVRPPAPAAKPPATVPKAPVLVSAPSTPEWHVAIAGVPTGPLSKEDIRAHIASGTVNRDSLVWREGQDNWRSLSEVRELLGLLQRSLPPPPARATTSQSPVRTTTERSGGSGRPGPLKPIVGGVPRQRTVMGIGTAAPAAMPQQAPTRTSFLPAQARAAEAENLPVVSKGNPISGIQFPSTQPSEDSGPTSIVEAVQDYAQMRLSNAPKPVAAAISAPNMQAVPINDSIQANAFPEAPARSGQHASLFPPAPKPQIGVGAWMAIAGAAAFGAVFAVILASRFLPKEASSKAEAAAPQTPADITTRAQAKPVPETSVEGPVAAEAAEEEAVVADNNGSRGRNKRNSKEEDVQVSAEGNGADKTSGMSAAELALLKRMGIGAESGIANLKVKSDADSNKRGSGLLTGEKINEIVSRNKPVVQQCYEVAARGSGITETLKISVEVTIGTSGIVTFAKVNGRDVGNLAACIERSVKRWRFPASSEETSTKLPFVFQPGS